MGTRHAPAILPGTSYNDRATKTIYRTTSHQTHSRPARQVATAESTALMYAEGSLPSEAGAYTGTMVCTVVRPRGRYSYRMSRNQSHAPTCHEGYERNPS